MKMNFFFLVAFLSFQISNAQSNVNLAGKRFEQYTKSDGLSTILEFKSNTKALYIMSGVLPFSGNTFHDVCPCTSTVNGNKIKIKCICDDKETYPEPIEDSYIFDKNKKQLISTRYKYTNGSAPNPELAWKYFIWNQR